MPAVFVQAQIMRILLIEKNKPKNNTNKFFKALFVVLNIINSFNQ